MLASDVIAWLAGNSDPGYTAHVRAHQAENAELLRRYGVEGTELADLYLHHGPLSVRGWYTLNELDEVSEWTSYAETELGVPPGYLALTGIEGQGITLYKRATGQIFDVEFGQFERLVDGTLLPVAQSFGDFLRWCRDQSHAA
jgi:hypothetical protein